MTNPPDPRKDAGIPPGYMAPVPGERPPDPPKDTSWVGKAKQKARRRR